MSDDQPHWRGAKRPEPFYIKSVAPINLIDREAREQALQAARLNLFNLKSRDVFIDLLTDSGTGAMSHFQWSALMIGDEAYAGSGSFDRFEQAVQDIFGFEHVLPTHQGRSAELILMSHFLKPGDIVPNNIHFDTTAAHVQYRQALCANLVIDEIYDWDSEHPFKGNMDLARLEALLKDKGEQVPLVCLTLTCNSGGGQPVSVENVRAVKAICAAHGKPLLIDSARVIENAWFIKQREEGYADKSVAEIMREICDYSDGATVSSKKDNLVNIGGFLALRDPELAKQARALLVAFEGLHTYGGMSGRDMEALARGIYEMVDTDDHVRARVGQVEYLGDKLVEAGVPIIRPVGGHGVFLDAKAILPHLPHDEFPAQALAAALYVESGVRGMERGIVSAGRNKATGDHNYPKLELVRLTIPRRVYTQAHMDVTAESVIEVVRNSAAVGGLRFTYEPESLRFFQARFEPVA